MQINSLKVLSLFSGIGAFEKAIKNINVRYELVGFCENDPYPANAYCLIHNESPEKNIGDIQSINANRLPNCDLITYGFPCVDISSMGKQEGLKCKCEDCKAEFGFDEIGKDDTCPICGGNNLTSATRSGLLYEALKVIEAKKPKYAVAENVKMLMNKTHKNDMKNFIKKLNELGYNSYIEILNSKFYGTAQCRERVFVVSIRKDIDDKTFHFPAKQPINKHFIDYLKKDVQPQYYLSEKALKRLEGKPQKPLLSQPSDNIVIHIQDSYRKKVYDPMGMAPTVMECHGDVIRVVDPYNGRIRKTDPYEAFDLMGFSYEDCKILKNNGMSDARIYKMAGNSISVNTLEEIFKILLNKYIERD